MCHEPLPESLTLSTRLSQFDGKMKPQEISKFLTKFAVEKKEV